MAEEQNSPAAETTTYYLVERNDRGRPEWLAQRGQAWTTDVHCADRFNWKQPAAALAAVLSSAEMLDLTATEHMDVPPNSPNTETTDAIDARRYRRLRVLGCAPDGSDLLERGLVMRFTNLDDFIDRDLVTQPSRGEAKPENSPAAETTTPTCGGERWYKRPCPKCLRTTEVRCPDGMIRRHRLQRTRRQGGRMDDCPAAGTRLSSWLDRALTFESQQKAAPPAASDSGDVPPIEDGTRSRCGDGILTGPSPRWLANAVVAEAGADIHAGPRDETVALHVRIAELEGEVREARDQLDATGKRLLLVQAFAQRLLQDVDDLGTYTEDVLTEIRSELQRLVPGEGSES